MAVDTSIKTKIISKISNQVLRTRIHAGDKTVHRSRGHNRRCRNPAEQWLSIFNLLFINRWSSAVRQCRHGNKQVDQFSIFPTASVQGATSWLICARYHTFDQACCNIDPSVGQYACAIGQLIKPARQLIGHDPRELGVNPPPLPKELLRWPSMFTLALITLENENLAVNNTNISYCLRKRLDDYLQTKSVLRANHALIMSNKGESEKINSSRQKRSLHNWRI